MNKTNRSYWLYLHPYVHISKKKVKVIIYNTLNGKILEYNEGDEIFKIIRRLNSEKNLYVIKLNKKDINYKLMKFIKNIRKTYIGDIMNTSYSIAKPIQFKPILGLQKNLDEITSIKTKNNKILAKDELKEYINVLNFYINNNCDLDCSFCNKSFKQFLCCFGSVKGKNEIKLDKIKELINELKISKLYKLNILGGNIFKHSQFNAIASFLKSFNIKVIYFIHYLNIESGEKHLKSLAKINNNFSILVDLPVNYNRLKHVIKLIHRYNQNLNIQFIIEKEKDVSNARILISDLQIKNFSYEPYFNGNNLKFFDKNIFLNQESILNAIPTMKDVFVRMTINPYDFKRLTIMSNLDVHANINNPRIGSLIKDSLIDIINFEINNGKSWTKVRKNVLPCKSCVYNALCPPISNFEYVLGKNNLCDVWK